MYFDFFQLKDSYLKDISQIGSIPERELNSELKECLLGQLSPNHRMDDWAGYINLPLSPGNFFWNEELSIYTIMFYLSSLVRYHPDELDEKLEDKLAWLIESFIAACPIHFLKIITSRITHPSWVIQVS